MPWYLRRRILNRYFHYDIHSDAHIGLAYVFPKYLKMEAGATIDHFTVAIHLDCIEMGEKSTIGRSNWISGFPTNTNSRHFAHDTQRKSELILGNNSAITKHHHIDCTNAIHIGDYVTIAGYQSQLLTHSIDIYEGRQDSHPITIGDYCFVSTGVKILGGAELPAYSVLAAGGVLNKAYCEEWSLYGGVPAKKIKDIPRDAKYFARREGFVY
jgi:acetyltransferase-like isoleucine patch superfamily enzyme